MNGGSNQVQVALYTCPNTRKITHYAVIDQDGEELAAAPIGTLRIPMRGYELTGDLKWLPELYM